MYYAHGKLLLTGEYFVLDGAKALAMPTKLGQSLTIQTREDNGLYWKSLDNKGQVWFDAIFDMTTMKVINSSDQDIASRLLQIFEAVEILNPNFFSFYKNISATSQLEFPRDWGLGSSSTLLCCIAEWAQVNAFELSKLTFGGSGYDIACGIASSPISYQLNSDQPLVTPIPFNPSFKDALYFVYLGKKQDTREGIARYRQLSAIMPLPIRTVSALTDEFINAIDLATLENLIRDHEEMVSNMMDLQRAKSLHFSDFWGEIKSLGAWGGDFVMATSDRSMAATKSYFQEKGFNTILTFEEMFGV